MAEFDPCPSCFPLTIAWTFWRRIRYVRYHVCIKHQPIQWMVPWKQLEWSAHFKLQCKELMDRYYTTSLNILKMKQLMNSTDHSNLINLAIFIIIILKEFSHTINANTTRSAKVKKSSEYAKKANRQLYENKIVVYIDCDINSLLHMSSYGQCLNNCQSNTVDILIILTISVLIIMWMTYF